MKGDLCNFVPFLVYVCQKKNKQLHKTAAQGERSLELYKSFMSAVGNKATYMLRSGSFTSQKMLFQLKQTSLPNY